MEPAPLEQRIQQVTAIAGDGEYVIEFVRDGDTWAAIEELFDDAGIRTGESTTWLRSLREGIQGFVARYGGVEEARIVGVEPEEFVSWIRDLVPEQDSIAIGDVDFDLCTDDEEKEIREWCDEPWGYGRVGDSLIFLPLRLVQELTSDVSAICRLKTYGAARAFRGNRLPAPATADVDREDDDPYDLAEIEKYGLDIEWPPNPLHWAFNVAPPALDDREARSTGRGLAMHIDLGEKDDAIAALRDAGYQVRDGEALIRALLQAIEARPR